MAITLTATSKGRTPSRAKPIAKSLRAKAEKVLEGTYDYIDSVQFKRKNLETDLFCDDLSALPLVAWYQPTRDEAVDGATAGTPQLMSTKEEQVMFLRYNYCKYKLSKLQKQVEVEGLNTDLARQLVDWDSKCEHFREYLTRTNLALVLAMAKRTRLGDIDFAEIVSEGNMALLRAVEKFNVERGFKFSTYACRAILKAFSRCAQKHSKHRQRFPVEFEPDLEKSDWADRKRDVVQDDLVDELKQIVDRNLADLSNIEQTVIKQRFNWNQTQDAPLTLDEVGRIIGVTKERVRQIQNKALTKIRRLIDDGVLKPRASVATAELS